MKAIILVIFSIFISWSVHADESCTLPDVITPPTLQGTDCINKITPDYYALSISWSPQHCSTVDPKSNKHSFQCSLNRFGFVVHGLWGQNSKANNKCEQPRNCSQTVVDIETVRKTLCTVPGVDLIQGEWQKHGTCTGMSSSTYFQKTRELWESINKPDMSKIVNAENKTTAGEIVKAFVEINKSAGLTDDAVALQVASKNYLKEVFICYDTSFRYRACSTGRTPSNQEINVAPME
ncbi:ribonuclease T2 family protein [Aeromonas veronii]|uniref:ribonuclease T2 family protein n=1 Tax=Aeromonas veronii TaxID=654 RepID=UPI0030059365